MSIPYITYREPDTNGNLQYHIVKKDFPHWCGVILESIPDHSIANFPIAGYRLYLVFNYTLRGRMIPDYQDVMKEIQSFCEHAATWYLSNRIEGNVGKYRKFKI